jgi:hypothetical protein
MAMHGYSLVIYTYIQNQIRHSSEASRSNLCLRRYDLLYKATIENSNSLSISHQSEKITQEKMSKKRVDIM